MKYINRQTIAGFIGNSPELRYMPNGQAVIELHNKIDAEGMKLSADDVPPGDDDVPPQTGDDGPAGGDSNDGFIA